MEKFESSSLENLSLTEILEEMNSLDVEVPLAVQKSIPQIEKLVEAVIGKMKAGGRLFYIGAGSSGRLGVLDASECPPTFGVSSEVVVGIIAGGDAAIRTAVEGAEDDVDQAFIDLKTYEVSEKDFAIGVAASGSTPYVLGGLKAAKVNGISTGCIVCNKDSKIAGVADFPIEVFVGDEFILESTRMKAGTSQKLVLNMISTSVMIKLGKTKGNRMVDMKISNEKLFGRGVGMLVDELGVGKDEALRLLLAEGSVRGVMESYKKI